MTFLGNIHSSFRRPVHLAAASLLLSFALFATRSLPAAAQRFEKTVERNAWNMTSNVCGVRADSISISQAQLYGRYTDGGFRDLSDPERLWNVGAFAQTISHFGKVSMTGKFAFDNEESYKACGSMFSRPGAYPVDLFEFTPGRKTRQSYTVDGGIAARLSPLLTIGGKVEFLSSNYSKRKDLRYTDYLLDMKVTPSLLFSFGERVRLGLSYFYRRVAESLSAEELGISDQSYYAFLDKGLMYGSYDVWTGGASHLKEAGVSGFPVRENFHGLALQLFKAFHNVLAVCSHVIFYMTERILSGFLQCSKLLSSYLQDLVQILLLIFLIILCVCHLTYSFSSWSDRTCP